ncbi:MAG: hypothetical protein ACI4J1_00370 [Ruminiclostridium sp.]
MEMEAVLNDKVVIPERIKTMSKEQINAEIIRLEQEAAKQKKSLMKKRCE